MAVTNQVKDLSPSAKETKGKNSKASSGSLRRLTHAFGPYKIYVIFLLITIICVTASNLAIPLLIPPIFDDAIAHHNARHLFFYASIMVAATLLAGFSSLLQTYLNSFIGQRVMRDLRNTLYAHLQDMTLEFFTSRRIGEIQSRLSNDISGAQNAVTDSFTLAASSIVTTLCTIIAMLYISPLLTLISFLLLPVFLWVTYKVGKVRHRASKATQESLASLNALMQETLSISGILLIKTFGRKLFAKKQFAYENQELTDLGIHQQMVGRWFFMFVNIFFGLTPIIVYVIAGYLIINNVPTVTVGIIIAFIMLQSRFFAPFTQLLTLHVNIQGALAMFDRIFEYTNLPIDIQDAPNAIEISPEEIRGEVTFKNVSFAYKHDGAYVQNKKNVGVQHTPSAEADTEKHVTRETLKEISFTVKPGQLAALVGPSGAGKTTITYLIPRLYDVDSGAIEIDQHNIKDVTQASLSTITGIVTQETYLFHASIRENLLYVKPDITEEEMIAATRAAAIHDHIMQLDQGYDTVVGERGYKLSGGEKQRLAIARVLLKNPRILILDEATSSLDTQSERLIQLALEPLMKNRTTIAIAHRLSTIQSADVILVIDHGKIVEQGTHQELLSHKGLYAQLYMQQFAPKTPFENSCS